MELRHIRYFVAVAESGSVSTAARSRLHTSQPSLSRQLLELEDELGVKLFERRSRGVVLTDPGLVFLERSRRVLKEVDEAAAAARNTPAVLRLGVLPGLELSTLPRVVELARQQSPDAEIRVMSASSPRLIEELRAGNIDMAFMRQDEDAVDIHFEIAGYHGITAFLRDDHALAAKPELIFEDLIDQTYVSVGRRSATMDLKRADEMTRFKALLGAADIFFSNRRPGFLGRYNLTAEQLAEIKPGLIHVDMSLYGWRGPWADRIGFDQNAGGVSGVFAREGTAERPQLTEIFVVNDYAMSWIASVAVAAALQRRATEGGSYRIRISLARLSIWLLHMGIFDKAYASAIAGTAGDHEYLSPELFEADTPCGHYQGVTDQVRMSRTPGFYATPLVPRGSGKPEWLAR